MTGCDDIRAARLLGEPLDSAAAAHVRGCPRCRAERSRRASKVATRISLAATLLMGLYVALTMPPDPMARIYGAVAVLATYIIVRRIASRVAMETMK